MSCITSVLLSFSLSEFSVEQQEGSEVYPVLSPMKGWLAARQHGHGFVDIGHFSGGYMPLQANLFALAANHLTTDDILAQIEVLAWERPDRVQVWIMEQRDEFFTEYRFDSSGRRLRQRSVKATLEN